MLGWRAYILLLVGLLTKRSMHFIAKSLELWVYVPPGAERILGGRGREYMLHKWFPPKMFGRLRSFRLPYLK